jgi:outer membrane lipoprotein-sorting protein
MNRKWIAFAGLFLSQVAYGATGNDYLKALDLKANLAKDTWFSFEAVTQEPGKSPRLMVFDVQNQGEKRLVNFEAPGDMKGTRVLVLSRQQMWVYLPAYNKVRRVASHVTQQGFMGTTYSDEDMSTTYFGAAFEATIIDDQTESVSLKLTPKGGQKSGYQFLEMVIEKKMGLPQEIRYFNGKGVHVKTETRTAYECTEGVCTPGSMKMIDHTRGDTWTSLTVKDRKINQGIPDSMFSVRNLERGR